MRHHKPVGAFPDVEPHGKGDLASLLTGNDSWTVETS